MTINAFASQLGSTNAIPGGGAAGGVTLALGAACAEKAARFSFKSEEHELINIFAHLREKGLELAENDQKFFMQWQTAKKLPKEKEEEKRARQLAINKAALECARVPLELAQAAQELLIAVEDFLPHCHAFLMSDAACAASFARAAFETGIYNIHINLPYIKDENFRLELQNTITTMPDSFNNHASQIIDACMKKLKS